MYNQALADEVIVLDATPLERCRLDSGGSVSIERHSSMKRPTCYRLPGRCQCSDGCTALKEYTLDGEVEIKTLATSDTPYNQMEINLPAKRYVPVIGSAPTNLIVFACMPVFVAREVISDDR